MEVEGTAPSSHTRLADCIHNSRVDRNIHNGVKENGMSKSKLKICVCENCKSSFTKSVGEFNRKKKKGTPFYCSLSCSAKSNYDHDLHKKLNSSPKNIKHLKTICGNRRDKYSPYRMLLSRTKQRKKHNTLSLQYIDQLWEAQKGKCAVLGHTLRLPSEDRIPHNELASIDRIDSTKGYIEGNIRIVCATINYAKNKFSDAELKEFLRLCANAS